MSDGDLVDVSSATNSANNSSNSVPIVDVVKTQGGSYIVLDDEDVLGTPYTTVDESSSPALVAITSKYNVMPEGLKMTPDQVDIKEHEDKRALFLSGYSMRHYLKDTINGKDFIETEMYKPCALYSLPRKGRASLGYHVGPLPNVEIKTLNKDNITNPGQLSLKRTINKNFYNSIVYKFDERVLTDDFATGFIGFLAIGIFAGVFLTGVMIFPLMLLRYAGIL